MPLIRGKSKKAFEHNLKTEMHEGKPQDQALAIAYSVKRKKKMAEGGKVDKDPTETAHGSKRMHGYLSHGESPTDEVGYKNRNRSSDMDHGQKKGPQGYGKYQEQAQNQKGIHTPVSGVTGFPGAKGSSEAGKMATETWKGEPHRELREHGKELHKKKLEEMRSMPKPKLKGLAEGGRVTPTSGPRMTESSHIHHQPRTEASTGHLDERYGKMSKYADGGDVEDERDIEHHASIAAAMMARDEEREMMAEGGHIDITDNAEEAPSDAADEYTEAALKENYDSDMMHVDQPSDSNEHGDELHDEDEHGMTMIEKIMHRHSKRSPITR